MNITEFAAYAGVSKAAVSRYFNGGYLSDEKRQAIQKAVEETGYHPSESARSIRTHRTGLIGVILPKLSSESCARVTEGISQVTAQEGYQLLLGVTANNPAKEVEYLSLFKQRQVDGIILLATIFTQAHRLAFDSLHLPLVIVGQQYPGYSCVCHDDLGAAYALTRLMLSQGARRPGYLGVTTQDEAAGKERYQGFLKALSEFHLRPDPRLMCTAQFTIDDGYTQSQKLLTAPRRPDCLFCATDNIAIGAMQRCREMGLSIPDEIMICGVGDTKIGQVAAFALTTARLHYKTAGIDAARLLLAQIANRETPSKIFRLDYEILKRESTNRQNSETM